MEKGQANQSSLAEIAAFGRNPKDSTKTKNGESIVPGRTGGTQGIGGGNPLQNLSLPGIGLYKVDIDNLSLLDYYSMKDYYQIKTAFAMISFTLMSLNWWVTGGTAKTRKAVEWQIKEIWSDLMKTIVKAFWAGFSPNVKVFGINPENGYLYIEELRDLSPFACEICIDKEDQSFDGFIQKGGSFKINTITNGSLSEEIITVKPQKIEPKYAFWYSFMKENGNFYGQKLLKGAYMPWFFSQVIHLYVNRYFYRFSTPLALGRAPSGFVQDANGKEVDAQEAMITILKEVRNNSSVSLPSDRDENGNLAWDVEYIESQMRGYDFEGYLKRLDREMSRALFLPDLLFEAGKVGSYKLGELHKDTFLMLLNALMNDVKQHIDKYISKQFVEYNFGPNVEVPRFQFEKQGTVSTPIIVEMIKQLTTKGALTVDIEEIARITGVPLKEVKKIFPDEVTDPSIEDPNNPGDNTSKDKKKTKTKENESIESRLSTMLEEFKKEVDRVKTERFVDEKFAPKDVKIDNNEFYDSIMYIAANQLGRIGTFMDSNERVKWPSAKLGYRSKLEKVWKAYVTEDIEGLYDSVFSIVTAALSSDKSNGEIKKFLWDEITGFYLAMAFRKNPGLVVGIASKVDSAINKAI